MRHNRLRTFLLAGCAAVVLGQAGGALAQAADRMAFDIPAQPLGSALTAFAQQSKREILFSSELTRTYRAPAVRGDMEPTQALEALLGDSGLRFRTTPTGSMVVEAVQDPQGASADAAGDVDALIVTAQKREEAIQDVPIAISAFTQKNLEEQKIEGGYDLMKAIPNVTFSKSNFSSYNFSIRGVGTKAVSATTDPGVSVAFNNTGLIQNRLFEQEYFDVERVEVLRGPQGTLYGRNATSGVINVITAKPDLSDFKASLKLEAGNYEARRVVGMMNIPIVEDMLAVRAAGAMTQRSGYDYNSVTQNAVNGRDLWSGRVTVGFEPFERLRANLLWEHFEEDDNRSRTGKQLCHRDPGPQVIGNTILVGNPSNLHQSSMRPAMFGQGCKPGNLYADEAFGTPNGLSLPFVFGMLILGGDCGVGCTSFFPIGLDANGRSSALLRLADPYGGKMQSRDLRTIASFRDPVYRAKADLFELSVDFDLTDSLTLTSQTAYNKDEVYSFQDFNRFNTDPVFVDTSALTPVSVGNPGDFRNLAPRPEGSPLGTAGVFCDPQLGCSDTLAGFDISQAEGEQFSQELRVQSAFDGPVNFSFGANYTEFETLIDYYVFYNLLSAYALIRPFSQPTNGVIDITICPYGGLANTLLPTPVASGAPGSNCAYIDPNPIESIDGEGHNYFRSKNPYKLKSKAAFGEFYWNVAEALKLTAGLRYTQDRKYFTLVPSQVLLATGLFLGGTVSKGYPEKGHIIQEWGEWTGRLGLDWKPELSFTDETMLYAFYSRGYKAGGANPPQPGFSTREETLAWLEQLPADTPGRDFYITLYSNPDKKPILELTAVEYGRTFEPEFVDAYEVGVKNTLLGGAMTLNATGFYYDYRDYQVSQIRDRTAVNENFDATIWGLEFEALFAPTRNLRINANLGYLDTKIADGASSIDIMNRTQGNPNYVLAKPWPQLPSNCVVPTHVGEAWVRSTVAYYSLCGGTDGVGTSAQPVPDSVLGGDYDVANYPELNGGAGLRDDLGGNELPNAPHWTTNVGLQYGRDVGSWRATLRTDAYWQSQSFARVYNAVNDKLHGWYNLNLSVWLEQPDWGVKVELYAKNILDATPITDAFLNSDDTALTTNVFVLDPRLIGLSIRKEF